MNLLSKAMLELRRQDVDRIEETCQLASELEIAMSGHKFETLAQIKDLNGLVARCQRRLNELAGVPVVEYPPDEPAPRRA